jgi:hypothetical protein
MKASTNIVYHGLPLAVYHTTETRHGSTSTHIDAIRSRAMLGQHIKQGQDITGLLSVREQLDILHRALNGETS